MALVGGEVRAGELEAWEVGSSQNNEEVRRNPLRDESARESGGSQRLEKVVFKVGVYGGRRGVDWKDPGLSKSVVEGVRKEIGRKLEEKVRESIEVDVTPGWKWLMGKG